MSEKLSPTTYAELKSEVKDTVSQATHNNNVETDHDRRFTATFNGQNSGIIAEYSRAATSDADVYTESHVMPKFGNDEVRSQLQSSVTTEASKYTTKVSDEAGLFEGDNREPATTVSRVENGEVVTRSIKNPRAAELVTRLAMKRISAAESQGDKKVA